MATASWTWSKGFVAAMAQYRSADFRCDFGHSERHRVFPQEASLTIPPTLPANTVPDFSLPCEPSRERSSPLAQHCQERVQEVQVRFRRDVNTAP